ncbi:MAG: DEAD/DEAH box helicase family protein [Nanoarchaeota archaeon]
MALHRDFPKSPHEILNPGIRWYPGDELIREKGIKTLLPPLVHGLRLKVKEWRDKNYEGASETSKALLKHWFETEHIMPSSDGTTYQFQYFFAQREAIETIIYLHDVVQVKDKYDLMRVSSSETISAIGFHETWKRFVIKMATGSGKTKVLSLVLAWSYFHKIYEIDSDMARNFLLITPNIIVLDRIRGDFEGLKIFFDDPILPDNGFMGKNWKDDFQLTVHLQDNVNVVKSYGNIFLTNIHRVFDNNQERASFQDHDTSEYFLGSKPVTKTTDSKIDLGDIVRDIDELMILNDEAHHIHDPSLAWFKSIQDIHNKLLQKDSKLAMQIDVTATPRDINGAIFVQTIVDYPLVEAIYQNVVKHPLIPDSASRNKLNPKKSAKYSEKYEDYLHLGYLEWKKVYDEHQKFGKKAVLFVMTDDTRNCDEIAEYLKMKYQEFKDSVLVIHTKNNGEITEASTGKGREELESLRKEANDIDNNEYKVIVSVMMLKEGWDVKNVTTIVGLRAYGGGKGNNVLPEQTLGRGLRRMYRDQDIPEYISVIGTDAFMTFINSITDEGVILEQVEMGVGTKPKTPLVVEIDNENVNKDIKKLDIQIPILTPRTYREFKNLSELDVSKFDHKKVKILNFSDEEKREIIFKNLVAKEQEAESVIHHKTVLDINNLVDYRSVIRYFTQIIMNDLKLFSEHDILYAKVKEFIKHYLFENEVDLEDMNILRNLSELEPSKTVVQTFKKKINDLTVMDKGKAEIRDYIKLSECRPFFPKDQEYIIPKKSVFNKIIGDSHLEVEFATYLERCDDLTSYAKNYLQVNFKIDYKNADGNISNYYPDFIIKKSETEIFIIETKGQEDLDVPLKIERLKQWCIDVNKAQTKINFDFIFVDELDFHIYPPKSFQQLIDTFRKYK